MPRKCREYSFIMQESWHTRKDISVKYTRTNESKITKLRIKLNHDQQQVMVRKIINFFFPGCKLVIWDVNGDGLEVVAKEIEAADGVVHSYKCNLRDRKEISKTAEKVKEEVGEVSLLINNAGIVTGKKFMDCCDEEISATIDVNILSHFWVSSFLSMASN